MSKYKQGKVLSASYDVWINGSKLGIRKKECITSLEIEETTEGADTMTISISDPNFEFIEDDIFLEDTPIKVKLGWAGNTYRNTFSGWVTAIDIDFKDDGVPTLNITCMDETHRMNREKHSKTWNNVTSAQVIEEIVKSYGFKFESEAGYTFTTQETITQSNQTDIEFIESLASEETSVFTARLVDSLTFQYVKKGKLGFPVMTLNYVSYPHEIISFSPSINVETRQESVTSGTVTDEKKVDSTTLGSSSNNSASGNTSGSFTKSSGNSSSSGGTVTYDASTGKYT